MPDRDPTVIKEPKINVRRLFVKDVRIHLFKIDIKKIARTKFLLFYTMGYNFQVLGNIFGRLFKAKQSGMKKKSSPLGYLKELCIRPRI
jgi:hypothetical protein